MCFVSGDSCGGVYSVCVLSSGLLLPLSLSLSLYFLPLLSGLLMDRHRGKRSGIYCMYGHTLVSYSSSRNALVIQPFSTFSLPPPPPLIQLPVTLFLLLYYIYINHPFHSSYSSFYYQSPISSCSTPLQLPSPQSICRHSVSREEDWLV